MRVRCVVPLCTNTSKITPNKLFFRVPNNKTVRDKWLKLARKDPEDTDTNLQLYFCEDHFDLPNDMENYMQYLWTGPGRVVLKPNSFPKKFPWQHNQKSVHNNNYDELKMQLEGGIVTELCNFVEIGPQTLAQMNLEDAQQATSEVIDPSIQVCRVCLARNVRMYHISEHQLSAMYERVTGIEINAVDKLPRQLCWECFARLSSANRFVAKALKAHWLLLNEINSGRLMTASHIETLDKAQHKLESTLGTKFHDVNEYDFLFSEETVPNNCHKIRVSESPTTYNEDVSAIQLNTYKEEPIFTAEVLANEEYIVKEEPVQLDEKEVVTAPCKDEKEWSSNYPTANKSASLDDGERNTCISNEAQKNIIEEDTHDKVTDETSQEGRLVVERWSEVCEVIKQNYIGSNNSLSPLRNKNQPDCAESVMDLEYIDCDIFNSQNPFKEHVPTYGNAGDDISGNSSVSQKNSNLILINNESMPMLFTCDICDKSFIHKPALMLHIQKHSMYYCIYCSYKTYYSSIFRAHNNDEHANNIVFYCSYCNYVAYEKSILQRHINAKHTKSKVLKCPHCNYESYLKPNLQRHINAKHTKSNVFKCSYCVYKTCDKDSLHKHINSKHTKSEVFNCSYCSYKAYRKRCLERHVNTKHTKSKVFKCPFCIHETYDKAILQMHVITKHTKSAVLHCPHCGYETYVKSNLLRHINAKHTKNKLFKCSYCYYKTCVKVSLQEHINSKHTKSEVFNCSYCSYKAYRKRCLEQHVNSRHTKTEVFKCPFCIHKTFNRTGLRLHINSKHTKSQVFSCPNCSYKAYRKACLVRHVNSKHAKSEIFNC